MGFETVLLRNNIDLVEPKILAPGVLLFENILSEEKCSHLIDILSNHFDDLKSPAAVIDIGKSEGYINPSMRKNDVWHVPAIYKNPIEVWEISQIVWTYGQSYAQRFDYDMGVMEPLQFLRYSCDEETFFNRHVDGLRRWASAVFYLNDVAEGGETVFSEFGISIKPKRGDLVLFPAQFPYFHEAKRPISNDKWVAVTWFKHFDANDSHDHTH